MKRLLKTTAPDDDAVTMLAKQVEEARGRRGVLDPDAVAALTHAPSDVELAKIRDNAQHARLRKLQADRDELDSQLAAQESLRDAQVRLLEIDIRDAVDARKALAEERRTTAAAARLAAVHRWSIRTPIVFAVMIAAGMIWAAINVQQNMAPGGASDPMFWASFLVEGMVSGSLIMLAVGSNVVRANADIEPTAKMRWAEAALLMVTLALNTYPYVRDGRWYDTFTHAIAPVLIGFGLICMHALGAHYAAARHKIAEEMREQEVHLPDLPSIAQHFGLTTVHGPDFDVHGVEGDSMATTTVHPVDPTEGDRAPATVHSDESDRAPATEPVGNATHGHPETTDADEVVEPRDIVTVQSTEAPVQAAEDDRAVVTVHPDSGTDEAVSIEADDAEAQATIDDQYEPAVDAVEVVESEAQVSPELVADIEAATAGVLTDRASRVEADRVTMQPQVHGARSGGDRARETVHPDPVGAAPVNRTVQPTVHGSAVPVPATVQPADDAAAKLEHWVHGVMSGVQVPADLATMAAQVHSALVRPKYDQGHVLAVLMANRVHGHNPSRIYRDGGPHRDSAAKWLKIAEGIEAERADAAGEDDGALASVITLRKS